MFRMLTTWNWTRCSTVATFSHLFGEVWHSKSTLCGFQ
jgi:hypothetical protein